MQSATFPNQDDLSLELHQEEIVVTPVARQGETVRVSTRTLSRDQMVEADLIHERVEIERVPIGREVDVAPPIRMEGDTTIISVVEEVVVVERRLVLKEEVHVRLVQVHEQHREIVTVREQEAVITRLGAPSD